MLQCITSGSASVENGDELEDGINLNITAAVGLSSSMESDFESLSCVVGIGHIGKFISNG